jgi:hypothetical protein
MSQLSDPFPSSLYGDSFDQSSIIPDDIFSDLPDTEQTESQTVQTIPSSLERVKDQTKSWVRYTSMTKDDFVNWWLHTQYGSKPEAKRVSWDKTGYSSDMWPFFDQIAHSSTGQPKVICKQCNKMYDHPTYTTNGTNGPRRHWKKGKCKPEAKQANIQQLLQQTVG